VSLSRFRVLNVEMGSEGPKRVTIHVTGFKKFQGVAVNPTEIIVSRLKNYVESRGLPTGVSLGSCTVLESAGVGELPKFNKVLESGLSSINNSSNEEVVWLHLGLNSGVLKFAIERQAVNEATFCCPDEHGWQPQVYMLLCCDNNVCLLKFRLNLQNDIFSFQQLPIVPGDGGIAQARETSCSVEEILQILKNGGHDVMISDDAGRFVCNYVYYHSLRFAEEKGHKSLFVHVPLFSSINEEAQMKFTAALLEAIASTC
ncbi:hypothetical protein RJ640_016124, partial [Escallonia rubra]